MDPGLDSRRRELPPDCRAVRYPGDGQVVGAHGSRLLHDQAGRRAAKGGAVPGGNRPACRCPGIEPGQLGLQHHGLQGVKATRGADGLVNVPVMSATAVIAEAPEPVCQLGVSGHDGAGIAEGTEILTRVEAEAARAPD